LRLVSPAIGGKAVMAMALWGKKGDPAPAPAANLALAGNPAATKETSMALVSKREDDAIRGGANAVLGKGTTFEGKLTFEGEVQIDGRFSGEIFSKDRLVVGEDADVQAEINAGVVIVYGRITGNIKTTSMVELKANAKVKGNIETPALIIEKGVIFEGSCKMESLGKPATITPIKGDDKK
jgi:cytoskeletal protein CcmA (bactofilin family)